MIIDNGSYGSTGDQPTYTGKKTDLARSRWRAPAGCDNVVEVRDAEQTGAGAAGGDSTRGKMRRCWS